MQLVCLPFLEYCRHGALDQRALEQRQLELEHACVGGCRTAALAAPVEGPQVRASGARVTRGRARVRRGEPRSTARAARIPRVGSPPAACFSLVFEWPS